MENAIWLVTYSGRLGDRYTGLGTQNLVRKNQFSSFLLSVEFQQKKCVEVAINDFTMHLIVSKWLIMQKRRQKRKTMRERGWSERRNCQKKYFDPFNYVADHANICFFLNVNSLHCFFWFDLYYLLHLLSSNCFANPRSCRLEFFWIYEFFKK